MARGQTNGVLQFIRYLAETDDFRKLPDHELLRRFIALRSDAAFAALVRRHGPMVLRLCRRVLQNESDAEDAFQATFLVLTRKVDSVRPGGSLAGWLYGVAYRIAQQSRIARARRLKYESAGRPEQVADPLSKITLQEAHEILDRELACLPDKLRMPLVLCYLESLTGDEAAHQLGLTANTLKSRLEQARERLRRRLQARGLGLSAALVASLFYDAQAWCAVPTVLVNSTVQAATAIAAGGAATAVSSAKVAALAEGVLKTMFLTKLKIVSVLVLTVATLGMGTGFFVFHGMGPAEAGNPPVQASKNESAQAGNPAKTDKEKLQGTWIVASAKAGGEPAPDYINSLKLVFVDDKVTFHYTEAGNALVKECSFRLDSTKNPKEIDFMGDGKTTECIYTIEKDRVKVAMAEIGQGRPTELTSPSGTRQVLIVFQRELQEEKKKDLDDAAFLRRASLDIRGIPATDDEVKKFLQDKDAAKRDKVIDKWLGEPEYAERLARRGRSINLDGLGLNKEVTAKLAARLAILESERALTTLMQHVHDSTTQLRVLDQIERAVKEARAKIKQGKQSK